MLAKSHIDLHNIRLSVERARNLSDRMLRIGPFGIGLDGLLAWIPGAGQLYSLAAGSFILAQGVRARASVPTLASMAGVLLVDSLMSTAPIVGQAADMFFTGHKWAANMLLKHMNETHYVEGAVGDPAHYETIAAVRAGLERRRVVFLHDRFPMAANPV